MLSGFRLLQSNSKVNVTGFFLLVSDKKGFNFFFKRNNHFNPSYAHPRDMYKNGMKKRVAFKEVGYDDKYYCLKI